MFLPRVFVQRPVMATMLALTMIVFGLLANFRLGVSLFPDVDFPIITITTVLPGASPEIVEEEAIEAIEDAVSALPSIKSLRSVSAQGIGQVYVEFETTVDVDVAAQDVRDRIQTVLRQLQDAGAEPPTVEKLDLDAQPVLVVIVSGPDDVREVTEYAERLRERLQQVSGVGMVRRVGGREREVRVWLDAAALDGYGLSSLEVLGALRGENVEIPGGRFDQEQTELVVRTDAQFTTVADVAGMIVAHRAGSAIRLGQIASIEDGLEDERTIARYNGEPAISLQVQRRSGSNIVAVSDNVKAALAEIQAEERAAGTGYEFFITQDMAHFVEISIDAVKTDVAIGAAFTFLVILFFLFNARLTFVAVVIIPCSLLATLMTIYFLGFTLNNITMLAISLVVGIVVDDAIVMLENIHRHYEMGKSRMQAALDGANEIGFAIITVSSVLMAVFLPVGFMSGLVGQFFYEFGVTVAVAIAWSLTLALTLTPMLCSRIIRRTSQLGPVARRIDGGLTRLSAWYRKLLALAIRRRLGTIGIAVAVLIASFVMAGMFVPFEFVPQQDRGEFSVNVRLDAEIGANPAFTEGILRQVEAIVRENPYVAETYLAVAGDPQQSANVGSLYVALTPFGTRPTQGEIQQAIRERLALAQDNGELYDSVTTNVSEVAAVGGGGFASQPIQYVITGPDIEELQAAAMRLAAAMRDVPGLADVSTSAEAGKPELVLHVDRERTSELGVSGRDIGMTIQALVGGVDAGALRQDGEQYTIRLRLTPAQREHIDDLLSLSVRSQSTGALVPLRNLVVLDRDEGPTQVDRLDRERQVTVFANLAPIYENGPTLALGDGAAAVERIVAEQGIIPEGPYQGRMVGFAELMEEAFGAIFVTMAISLFIVYALLASLFNSFVQPITILSTVPLAIAGALFALVLTQAALGIITMIGFMMLFGLVTKNAIILLDFVSRRRADGLDCHAAILEAGPIRLRPILMTAVSSVAAMIPVAFFGSEGSEARAPMAMAVIGGMILATGLTLLVVPAVYSLLDSMAKNPLTKAIGRFVSPPERDEPTTGELQPSGEISSQAPTRLERVDPPYRPEPDAGPGR